MTMPEYKLYYFNGRGRAEIARLLLAVSGTKYEDIRFRMDEEWNKFKTGNTFYTHQLNIQKHALVVTIW